MSMRCARVSWRKNMTAAALILVAVLPSAGPAAARDNPLTGEETSICEQKALLLKHLLNSASTRRTEEAGTPAAKEKIARSRAISESLTPGALRREDCARADTALRLMSGAAAGNGGPARQDAKSRYIARRRQVRAYVQAISMSPRSSWPDAIRRLFAAVDLKSIEAAKLAEGGRYEAAYEAIDQAYRDMLVVVRAIKNGETVVHELKFETPQEEYQYELDRNRSFEMLLQISIVDSPVSEELSRHYARVVTANDGHRREAAALADAGKFGDAILKLELANRELGKMLRLMGIFVGD